MCGRFALPIPFARLVGLMRGRGDLPVSEPAADDGRWRPSWNIAPRATVPALVAGKDGAAAWSFLRWGLVPRWAPDPAIGDRLINARIETVATKPSFREAWRRRRCLVPVAAFYEWKRLASGREPWAFGPVSGGGEVLWLGAIHESWIGPSGEGLATFAIVTTAANEVVRPVHDRMPVIVGDGRWARWLGVCSGPDSEPPSGFEAPQVIIRAWRVSTVVNDARHDGAECLEPPAEGLFGSGDPGPR